MENSIRSVLFNPTVGKLVAAAIAVIVCFQSPAFFNTLSAAMSRTTTAGTEPGSSSIFSATSLPSSLSRSSSAIVLADSRLPSASPEPV